MTSIGIKFPTDLEQVKPTPEDVLLAANPEGVSRNVQVGELIEAVKENVPLETLVDTVSSQQSTINTMAHTAEGKDATIAQLTANQSAPALEAELAVGKTDLATAITAKGVETAATDSLATMADKVREIVQETTTISGGEFYPQNMLGTAVWNLFDVAAMVKSQYISSGRYAGAIAAQYYKGYATLDLTSYGGGYAACLTSDGDFYANDGEHTPIGVHTWHDDDSGKVDRYVVFLWLDDNYTFQTLSSGVCPREIVVLGTCASLLVDYNRLVQIYSPAEFGELKNFRLAGSNTPGGNWAAVQVWQNYKEHTAGTIFQNANNLVYVEFTNLERVTGGNLLLAYYNSGNIFNALTSVVFSNLTTVSGGVLLKCGTGNNGGSNNFSALTSLAFPKLIRVTEGILIEGGTGNSKGNYNALTKILLSAIEELPANHLFTNNNHNGAIGADNLIRLAYIYVGYTTNDRTLTVNLTGATLSALTDVELKDGYCKNLVCTYSTLTAENIVAHILNRLGVNQAYLDEPTDANKLTITLGATNLAKLTDEEKQIAINKGFTLA